MDINATLAAVMITVTILSVRQCINLKRLTEECESLPHELELLRSERDSLESEVDRLVDENIKLNEAFTKLRDKSNEAARVNSLVVNEPTQYALDSLTKGLMAQLYKHKNKNFNSQFLIRDLKETINDLRGEDANEV